MTRASLLGVVDVASYLNVPEKTIRDHVYRRVGVGQFAFKVGKHLRWEASDVDAFVQAQKKSRAK